MSISRRLSSGGLIDRSRPISFAFDGKTYGGYAGDTLASALLANDTMLVGRSFKYHRPRGIFSAGPEEPNALVTLRSGARAEPNTKATTIELFDGLEASSQNCWPSPNFDLRAVHQLAGPLLNAGFYYKTFMWPAAFWEKFYEPAIRRSAGLGCAERSRRSRHLREIARLLRSAGDRRRPCRPCRSARRRSRRCARDRGRGRLRAGRPPAQRHCTDRWRLGRLMGGAWPKPNSTRSRMSASSGAPPCSAPMTANTAPSSASAIICRCHRPSCRASGCGRSSRSNACSRPAPRNGRWCFPAMTGPASCWLRHCAAMPTASASRPASASPSSRHRMMAGAARSTCEKAGSEIAVVIDARDGDPARGAQARRQRTTISRRACVRRIGLSSADDDRDHRQRWQDPQRGCGYARRFRRLVAEHRHRHASRRQGHLVRREIGISLHRHATGYADRRCRSRAMDAR